MQCGLLIESCCISLILCDKRLVRIFRLHCCICLKDRRCCMPMDVVNEMKNLHMRITKCNDFCKKASCNS